MSDLLTKVDAEIKVARELNPIMAMGMLQIRKMIVEESRITVIMDEKQQAKQLLESLTLFVDWDCGWQSREGCDGKCVFGKKTNAGGFSICNILQHIERVLRKSVEEEKQ